MTRICIYPNGQDTQAQLTHTEAKCVGYTIRMQHMATKNRKIALPSDSLRPMRVTDAIVRPSFKLPRWLKADEQCRAMDGDIHIPLKKVETASIWPTFEHIMANLQSAVSSQQSALAMMIVIIMAMVAAVLGRGKSYHHSVHMLDASTDEGKLLVHEQLMLGEVVVSWGIGSGNTLFAKRRQNSSDHEINTISWQCGQTCNASVWAKGVVVIHQNVSCALQSTTYRATIPIDGASCEE